MKYRKKLLIGKIGEDIKKLLIKCSDKNDTFEIKKIETDKDHVHMLIEYYPAERITNIVKLLKSYSTYHIWEMWPDLKHQFWKKKMFWSPSYFVCSVGQVDEETIKNYIENQGKKEPRIHP